jgi:hypothetical protein
MPNWKLRYQYIAMGAVIGSISGILIGTIFYLATVGIFWVYIYGDAPWPEWSNNAVYWAFWLPFDLVLGIILFLAYRRAIKLEGKSAEHIKKSLKLNVNLMMAFLILFFSAAIFLVVRNKIQSRQEKMNQVIRAKLAPQLAKVEEVALAQDENNIKVTVKTKPPYHDKYQVVVNLQAVGFAQCPITQRVETVDASSLKDTFTFIIPFQEMALKYREELDSYVNNFSEEFGIDEMIEVTASLELFETSEYPHERIAKLQLPFSEQKAIALFYFKCFQDKCTIIQNPESNKP